MKRSIGAHKALHCVNTQVFGSTGVAREDKNSSFSPGIFGHFTRSVSFPHTQCFIRSPTMATTKKTKKKQHKRAHEDFRDHRPNDRREQSDDEEDEEEVEAGRELVSV